MNRVIFVLSLTLIVIAAAVGVNARPIPVLRIDGPTRIKTAVAVTQRMYPTAHTSAGVVIARAGNAVDALTVAPLADAMGGLPVAPCI